MSTKETSTGRTAARTVLFVDDDREFLLGKSLFFRNHGYEVLTAESAAEALELLRTARPDFIFLDLMMEHHDSGFTLSYMLRKDERFRDVPILMLSGVAAATGRRFDREEAGLKQWSRLDGFLDKPVTGQELLRVVEERLGKD